MYEMRAEPDESLPGPGLLWHATHPGGQALALCGRQLSVDTAVPAAGSDATPPTDRYCMPCLEVVREAMAN
ncbi:hypothetical protein [Kitasatospora camelliae]|uniref:DUF3039 domain-containing protein n=1 Tax=Kitasatospora camelliae TaxID=3156397 RepID=A0AAU8K1Z4_9ACTN